MPHKIKEKYIMRKWETGCLVLNLLTYKLFSNLPARFAEGAGTASWLAAVYSGAAAFLIILLITALYKKCGKRSLIELAESAFGSAGKYAATVFIMLYLLISAVFTLREFTGMVKFISFPTAPEWFVVLFFAAAMLLSVNRGMDSIIRTHVVAIPASAFLTVVIMASAVGYGDAENLFPLFGNSAGNVFGKGLWGISMYSDIILLFLVNPFCSSADDLKKTAVGVSALGVAINVFFILTLAAVIPYPVPRGMQYPVYQLLKTVYYGRFFQRIDALYMLAVVLSGMLYLSFVLFLLTYIMKKSFGTSRTRVFGAPFVLIIVLLAQSRARIPLNSLSEWLIYADIAAFAAAVIISAAAGRKGIKGYEKS